MYLLKKKTNKFIKYCAHLKIYIHTFLLEFKPEKSDRGTVNKVIIAYGVCFT